MVTKYYTPEIEEFHIGFEYEYEDLNEGGSSSYSKSIIESPDNIQNLIDGHEFSLDYRVKYLDEEDLFELGFCESTDESGAWETNDEDILLLEYFKEGKGWYITYSENESQFSFGGWIKNKSELRRLMKQLNITN